MTVPLSVLCRVTTNDYFSFHIHFQFLTSGAWPYMVRYSFAFLTINTRPLNTGVKNDIRGADAGTGSVYMPSLSDDTGRHVVKKWNIKRSLP